MGISGSCAGNDPGADCLQEQRALLAANRGEGEVDAGGFFGVEVERETVGGLIHGGDFAPGDELHPGLGLEKGEDLHAERSQDQVGVAGAVQTATPGDQGTEQGHAAPGPVGDGCFTMSELQADDGEPYQNQGEGNQGEAGALCGTGEAKFLVGLGNGHLAGEVTGNS
jgi:hypothetical protein